MVDLISVLKDWSWLIEWLLYGLVVIYAENKWNIVNRIRKQIARALNKFTEISITLQYTTNKDFELIKKTFKNVFREYTGFKILRENNMRMDFNYGLFSITVLETPDKNIYVKVNRMGCGIRDLHNKVSNFLGVMSKFENQNGVHKVFNGFLSCTLSVSLPYQWKYITINSPKGFELKEYVIKLKSNDSYKSKIDIRLDKINVVLESKEAILPLLGKLL